MRRFAFLVTWVKTHGYWYWIANAVLAERCRVKFQISLLATYTKILWKTLLQPLPLLTSVPIPFAWRWLKSSRRESLKLSVSTTKPFDLDEFLARVRNLLRLSSVRPEQTQDETETSFTFGPNTVNFKTFEACSASGETVVLTVLEMKLLRYFIKRQGEIVSREELQKNVWEIPADMNTRAVDQFIRRLRKYFEPDPANPKYFVTLRNIGYRFTPEWN